jgi:hypothetical protein
MEELMKKIYHLVLLKFAPQKHHRAAPLFADLEGLPKQIPGFLTIAGGAYSSPEGLNQGYTHGIVMTFIDAATRDYYLTHPDHEKLKQAFLPDLEGVIAFDFEGD